MSFLLHVVPAPLRALEWREVAAVHLTQLSDNKQSPGIVGVPTHGTIWVIHPRDRDPRCGTPVVSIRTAAIAIGANPYRLGH